MVIVTWEGTFDINGIKTVSTLIFYGRDLEDCHQQIREEVDLKERADFFLVSNKILKIRTT